MKSLLRTIFASLMVAFTLFSCTEDYFEFDKIKTNDWRPELALPLVNSTLSLADIVIKNDTAGLIQTNTEGKLEVVYKSTVFSIDDYRAYTVPTQTFGETFNTPVPIPPLNFGLTLPIDTTIDVEFTDETGFGIVVDSMILKQGQLAFTIENDYPYDITLIAKFRTFTDSNGDTLILNYSIPAAPPNDTTVRSQVVDLNGYQLNMTEDANGNPAKNRIPIDLSIVIQLINGVGSDIGDEVRVEGALIDIDFKEFYGYLGNKPVEFNRDTVLIDFFRSFQDFQREDFFISNPSLNVNIFNSLSVPIKFAFDTLNAVNTRRSPSVIPFNLPDSLKPLKVNFPAKYGKAITNFQLTRDNSNIDDVLSHLLQEIRFSASAQLNPDGEPNSGEPRNFITDTSDIGLDLEFRIPFEGRANGFFLEDTIAFNFELADELDNGLVRINTENGFPMKIDLQVTFIDSLGMVIDSLFTTSNPDYQNGFGKLILSAPIDPVTREAIGTTVNQTDVTISGERLQRLTDGRSAIISARLSTTQAAQQQNIIFSPSNRLEISIGLKAGILID